MFENLSTIQFALMVTLLSTIFVCFIVGLIITIKAKQRFRLFIIIALTLNSLLLLALIINGAIETYQSGGGEFWSEFGLYLCTVAIIAVIVLITFLLGKKIDCNHTKSIVYGALCIALGFALSYVRLFEMPQGGSVTLASLLPLMLYSYAFGIRKGVFIGIIYGLLQFIQAPWFYHPMQFLLDYPIAFCAVGLSGLLRELKLFDKIKPLQFALSAIIAIIIRYLSHVISGIFVFGSGDPENYSAVAWSFLYNSFAFVDLAIALVAGCALTASKSFYKLLNKAPL